MTHRTRLGLVFVVNALLAACSGDSTTDAPDASVGGSSTGGSSTSTGGGSGTSGAPGGASGSAGMNTGGAGGSVNTGGASGGGAAGLGAFGGSAGTNGGTAGAGAVSSGGAAGELDAGGVGGTGTAPNYPCPGKILGCNCTSGGVCGTGVVGDPFRCCNLAADTCVQAVKTCNYDPCKPLRCSIAPSCCIFFFEACLSDQDCGGRPGSCVDDLCQFPCDPSVNAACAGPSNTCQAYGGIGFQVPDDTPCDDGFICSAASPEPSLVDCVGTNGLVSGPDCTRDRPKSGATASDCPNTARICSGSGASLGDSGGAIVGGRCCPEGSACDLTTGKCRGNFGKGVNNNDVCRSGVCSYDTSTCQ